MKKGICRKENNFYRIISFITLLVYKKHKQIMKKKGGVITSWIFMNIKK